MSKDNNIVQRIATKALIINEKSEILILREASSYEEGVRGGRYQLPGGRLNPGEAFLDGLKREVNEETGLKIDIGKPIYVGEWRPIIKGVQNQIVAIYFICKAITTKVKLSNEHDDFKWVLQKNINKFDVVPPEDKLIQEFNV